MGHRADESKKLHSLIDSACMEYAEARLDLARAERRVASAEGRHRDYLAQLAAMAAKSAAVPEETEQRGDPER